MVKNKSGLKRMLTLSNLTPQNSCPYKVQKENSLHKTNKNLCEVFHLVSEQSTCLDMPDIHNLIVTKQITLEMLFNYRSNTECSKIKMQLISQYLSDIKHRSNSPSFKNFNCTSKWIIYIPSHSSSNHYCHHKFMK